MEKPFGFPKSRRIRKSAEYQAVRAAGRPTHGHLFLIGVLDHQNEQPPRVGIIASRKVGNSVTRSRVKRLLRELARHQLPQVRNGIDFVLIAKRPAADARLEDFKEEWLRLAKRTAILRPADA